MPTPPQVQQQGDIFDSLAFQSQQSQPQTQAPTHSGTDIFDQLSGEIKMVDRQGAVSLVEKNDIDSARRQGKMVDPSNGVKMVTPDGQITYALPNEVGKFMQSGHTLINPDGRFEVRPLPGETSSDTMARARNVTAALGPEQMQQARAAEQSYWTSKEGLKDEAKGLANVGIVAGGTLAAPVVADLGAAGVTRALAQGARLIAPRAITTSVGTGIIDAAGNEIMREATTYGPSILRAAATSPAAITAYKWLAGGTGLELARRLLGKFLIGSLGRGLGGIE